MSDGKAREGAEFLANGYKAVNKKSLFGKPKPDYDIAAHDFENAANCFRSARVYDKAVEALVQAANAQRELQALFMAAKSYESAASLVAQHLNRPADAAQHYRDASRYFLAHGTPERAAEMLEKAAQLMEATSADDAEQLYDAACAMYIDEDKRRFGVDCHKRATGFAIRQHRLAKALAYSRQLTQLMLRIDNLMGFAKQGLISVLILLAMGRVDDAHAQFREDTAALPSFGTAEEGRAVGAIFDAWEAGDADAFNALMRGRHVLYLDNDVARMAQQIRAPAAPASAAAGSGAPPPQRNADLGTVEPSSTQIEIQQQIEDEGFL